VGLFVFTQGLPKAVGVHRLANIKHLALDLDGTIYLGGRLFEWTLPFLDRLKALGIGRTFLTNNSSRSTEQYVHHLREMGIPATADEIYSSTHSTIDYLRARRPAPRRVYVMGTPALREEFAAAGFEVAGEGATDEPDLVIVAFDTTLEYPRVCRAAWWISRGKPFIATHPDKVCPTDKLTFLVDCGAMTQMLAHATGRQPEAVLGKPNPQMLTGILRRHGLAANQLGMVGDRLYTDMALARAAGAMGILVLSGEATREEAEAMKPAPDLIVAHVGELSEKLAGDREVSRC